MAPLSLEKLFISCNLKQPKSSVVAKIFSSNAVETDARSQGGVPFHVEKHSDVITSIRTTGSQASFNTTSGLLLVRISENPVNTYVAHRVCPKI